jgi:CDP-glucose 4,6-dehydratase
MDLDYLDLYNGKKVFVTGHTGFKGAWLLSWLYQLGAEVKGYALAPKTEKDIFVSINGSSYCESKIADIGDKELLKKEIINFQPDFIFHLAAQPLVRLSYELPIETYEVNVVGTGNVLDAVRFLDKPCNVICITTDKVYDNKEWHYPYRETDRLGGYDPYSASKAAAEVLISSYRNSFFNPSDYRNHQKSIAVARAGNVIGGGDWCKDRIIPDIINALDANESIVVRSPNAVRPWQHVLEPLSGYLLLGAKMLKDPMKFGDAFNFGPNLEDTLTVKNLVEIVLKKYGSGSFETPLQLNQPHEAGLLKLDINKAINMLVWKPKWNAERAIHETINWYKNKSNIKEFTDNQISSYIIS